MDKNWNNGSNSEENLPPLGFESLSLGQKLLSKCLKKTGISVSVRGIAVSTTSQIKVAGSAWKSEAKYDSTLQTKTGTLDDLSFPDLLGSSNRELSLNNQPSEKSSVTNENERVTKDVRRNRYRVKHRLPIVQAVNNTPYHPSRDTSYSNSSLSFKNHTFDEEEDIVGSDFLMPGMKGNYPLGFTNFIGKGVRSPPPPPPPLPYPTNALSIYQSYQQYSITRLKPGKTQHPKTNVRSESPTASESNWLDNKSDGYNEAELTTAIDSLNNSILADTNDGLTIKPFVSDKLAQSYLDLSNFEDNTILLQDSLSNQLDGRLIDQLENQLGDRLVSQLSDDLENGLSNELDVSLSDDLDNRISNELENTLDSRIDERLASELGTGLESTLTGNLSVGLEKRKKDRFLRRKRFTPNPHNSNAHVHYQSRPAPRSHRPRRDKNDNMASSQTRSNSAHSLIAGTPTLSSLLIKSPSSSRKPSDIHHKGSSNKIYNIPKPPMGAKQESSKTPESVDRLDRESLLSGRKPKPKFNPKRKDLEDNWRSSVNSVEPNLNENAVITENVHERRHFRTRPRYKQDVHNIRNN